MAVQQQQPSAAQMAAMQAAMNRQFMALSLNKEVLCQQANGGALSQSWSAGQPLTFQIATANNAFLTGYWISQTFTVTPATGTNAVYGLTAAGVLAMIDSIQVQYGGTQCNYRPAILPYLYQLTGRSNMKVPRSILAGEALSTLDTYYSSASFPLVAGSANSWTVNYFVPSNWLHPQDVKGILPIQNGETSCQIIVNCAGTALGLDPLLNAVYPVSGSGHALTVTGTIKVLAEYKDGMTYSQLQATQPALQGVETVQLMRDTPLNNVTAGQIYRNKVSFLKKIPYLIVFAIDGQQSNKYSTLANIAYIDTSGDSTGNRPFLRFGNNTNLDVQRFFDDLSGKSNSLLQQDLDEGVFPIVYGPIYQQSDASNLEGAHYLDCTIASGWTDFHYGFQFTSVGGATFSGFTAPSARLEAHVVLINDPLVM
jgi:hypothetical protein